MFIIHFLLRNITKLLIYTTIVVLLGLVFLEWYCRLDPPLQADKALLKQERQDISPTFRVLGNNWMRKNKYGLWEMYVQGSPYERGTVMGKLSKEQVVAQEDYFVAQIRRMIPSEAYLGFLRYFVGFFNRDLDYYVQREYQEEIFGISQSASEDYGFIGTPYERILNYHAAHDVGHALQDLAMVGCTSFSVWDSCSNDSSLIVGRNFDFYVGDDFAKEKIVAFVAPDTGYRFMYVTWGGMIGVTSGMNEEGLTVTINAAKSDLPTGAKVPIALVAREILQYARTIDEAFAIAKSRETFVSESLMIGSAADGQTAIIEKGLKKIALVKAPAGANSILCTNHYQSDSFRLDPNNMQNIQESSSPYRFQRTRELLQENMPLNYYNTAAILRDYRGLGGKEIGMGNEKALNQFIAHHSVIFMPEKGLAWVSSAPYQLGAYVCYNLKEIFDKTVGMKQDREICDSTKTIVADTLLQTPQYRSFEVYRRLKTDMEAAIKMLRNGEKAPKDAEVWAGELPLSNPHYFYAYQLVGDYYAAKGNVEKAKKAYQQALTKEITNAKDKAYLEKALSGLGK